MKKIRNILICGYGVMGRSVAKIFAEAGFNTIVKTHRVPSLPDLPLGVIAADKLPEDPPDLVIEFVLENVAVKRAVYAEIEAAYPAADVIIATGTSGLDIVQLADGLKHAKNFIGLHYFMPADKSLIVEVMAGPAAGREVVDRVALLMRDTGKEPICLYKPVVGFLLNRLQHAILHEAYYLIESGVATASDIDRAARKLLAPRMCLNGLIQQKDISGLKIHAEAQVSIVPRLYQNGIPNPMLQAMVARGETGLGAGKGFYDWSGCDVEAVRAQASNQLKELTDFIERNSHRQASKTQPTVRDRNPTVIEQPSE
jgi:3-hydroxybutyryl-CoA dehydrogenase